MVVLIITYFAVPTVRTPVVAAIGLGSVLAVFVGLRRHRTDRWAALALLAVSVVLLTLGDVAYGVIQAVHREVGYPDLPDICYVLAYVPLALGLVLLGRPRTPARDWLLALDTIAVGLAASLLVWITLVRPAVDSLHLTGLARVTAIASNVGYAAVFAAAGLVAVAWRANSALRVLGIGLVAFLISDYVYGLEIIEGTWSTGGIVDLGFLLFFVFTGAATLMPSIRQVASQPYERGVFGPGRLVMVAVGLLVAPTLLLVAATAGPVTTGVAIGLTTGAISLIMLLRISLTTRAYQLKVRRERAMRTASRALMLATDRQAVIDGLSVAVQQMVPGVGAGVRILDPGVAPEAGLGIAIPMAVPMADGPTVDAGTAVYTGPQARLSQVAPTLMALSEQAASAVHRVCAVERLAARDRERYFRTLVLTSQDATLISKDGRIAYATPSAHDLFGIDVLGRYFDDVVRRPDGRPWRDVVDGEEAEIQRADRTIAVLVHRRDLRADPTVDGVVTTLRDVTAERDLRRDLAYRASHDVLTGLGNPELFDEALRKAVRTPGTAVIFVDIDDFKEVNDSHGHSAGDQLLVAVAQRIGTCVGPDDLAARLGGDEFGVVLGNVPDAGAARSTAQRLTDLLARGVVAGDAVITGQASIGLAYAAGIGDAEDLVRQADIALYAAKSSGKGRWRQYATDMDLPNRRRAATGRRLRTAMDSGALTLYYQPIVELIGGVPAGFEALLRLQDDDEPLTPPQIITAADGAGLTGQLGEWILGRALADLPRFARPGPDAFLLRQRQLLFATVAAARLPIVGTPPSDRQRRRSELAGAGDHRGRSDRAGRRPAVERSRRAA